MQQLTHNTQAMQQATTLIAQYPLATVIAHHHPAQVCHLPLSYHSSEQCFYGHSAKNNPVINALTHSEQNQVKLIFIGQHSYISPTWHQDIHVPTWDYAAVHVNGHIEEIKETTQKQQLMSTQISQYEPTWQLTDLSPDKQQTMLKAITVFKIHADSFYGKFKLSQNKSAPAQKAIAKRRISGV